jgi:isopentenyldiphosphate isomerase
VGLKKDMIEENVIVNKEDEQIGLMPKMEAHEKHFCIVPSVFV